MCIMEFKLHSKYQPTGDQPQTIEKLVNSINAGNREQTLLGVTGSGKTFTMANVIQRVQRPTLVLAHNKTLGSGAVSSKSSFRKMRLNILCHTTITISLRHMLHRRILILKKTVQSMMRLINSATAQRLHFSNCSKYHNDTAHARQIL